MKREQIVNLISNELKTLMIEYDFQSLMFKFLEDLL